MSNSAFHQLYYHFVWATKGRAAFLGLGRRTVIQEYIAAQAKKRGAEVLACTAMPDHVHLFVALPPIIAVATFVGQVKGATCHAINRTDGHDERLAWQEGYGVVSLRRREAPAIVRYVVDQETIHASRAQVLLFERASN